jgi:hypothetical protein
MTPHLGHIGGSTKRFSDGSKKRITAMIRAVNARIIAKISIATTSNVSDMTATLNS